MERREFLKVLGLGGVALTLPKPLEVVAARMADLERPPLHIGRAELRLRDKDAYFMIYNLSVSLPYSLTRPGFLDFTENWAMRVGWRTQRTGLTRALLRMPCAVLPFGKPYDPALGGYGPLLAGMAPDARHYVLPSSIVLNQGEALEFWLLPSGRQRYPMPKVHIVLQGTLFEKERNGATPEPGRSFISLRFENVRVERQAAIRLGLAAADEPEDDISMLHWREVIRVGE